MTKLKATMALNILLFTYYTHFKLALWIGKLLDIPKKYIAQDISLENMKPILQTHTHINKQKVFKCSETI